MRRALLFAAALLAAGCITPMGPMERLSNAAYELNTATRFGRFDVALGLVERGVQPDFVRRHSVWGKKLRVVDLEVQSVRMTTPGYAQVQLEVSWHRLDQTTMRVSQVAQKWKQGDNSWLLAEEVRSGGDKGIFRKPRKKKEASPDATQGDLDSVPKPSGASDKEAASAPR